MNSNPVTNKCSSKQRSPYQTSVSRSTKILLVVSETITFAISKPAGANQMTELSFRKSIKG